MQANLSFFLMSIVPMPRGKSGSILDKIFLLDGFSRGSLSSCNFKGGLLPIENGDLKIRNWTRRNEALRESGYGDLCMNPIRFGTG